MRKVKRLPIGLDRKALYHRAVGIAKAFDIEGGRANDPTELASVLQRAVDVTREGRPFVVDVNLAQRGLAADVNWHPDIDIAALRTRKV